MSDDNALEAGNAVLQTINTTPDGRVLSLLLTRDREKKQQAVDKRNIEEVNKKMISKIDDRYKESSEDHLEEQFKKETVGLVSADEFREKWRKFRSEHTHVTSNIPDSQPRKKRKKPEVALLSFANEDSDEDCPVIDRIGKHPATASAILTETERETIIGLEKRELVKEFLEEDSKLREQFVHLSVSYWDGSNHQKSLTVARGETIANLVELARKAFSNEFPELKCVGSEGLLFVQEEVILPPSLTLHDIISAGYYGRTGALFKLDAERHDASMGKVVQKRWYEKNKHVYPASQWVPLDKGDDNQIML